MRGKLKRSSSSSLSESELPDARFRRAAGNAVEKPRRSAIACRTATSMRTGENNSLVECVGEGQCCGDGDGESPKLGVGEKCGWLSPPSRKSGCVICEWAGVVKDMTGLDFLGVHGPGLLIGVSCQHGHLDFRAGSYRSVSVDDPACPSLFSEESSFISLPDPIFGSVDSIFSSLQLACRITMGGVMKPSHLATVASSSSSPER